MTNASDAYRIMTAANERGLTVGGVRVTVGGAKLPFARVAVADRNSPLHGWSAEYAWETVERATAKGKLA